MDHYLESMAQFISKDLRQVLQYFPAGLAAGAAAAVLLALAVKCSGRPWKLWRQKIPWMLLAGYGAVTLFITFLSREPGSRTGTAWKLFDTVGHGAQGDAFVLENILLFIPLGILLPMAGRCFRRLLLCTALGCLLSCGIECAQHLTKRGFAQLDDIVTNTIGTVIGYGIYRGISYLLREE